MEKYSDIKRDLNKLKEDQRQKKITVLEWVDYEKLFQESINNETGFLIDDKIDYYSYFDRKDKEGVLELTYLNSIFSYKWGITDYDSVKVLDLLYSCNCGTLRGVDKLGETCFNCGTKVERIKEKEHGWFVLDFHKIIHPFILYMLKEENSKIERKVRKSNKKKAQEENENEEVEVTEEDEERAVLGLSEEEEKKIEEKPKKKRRGRKKIKNDDLPSGSKKCYSLMEALDLDKLDIKWKDILFEEDSKLEQFVLENFSKEKADLIMKYKDIWYTSKIKVIPRKYRYIKLDEVEVIGTNTIEKHPMNTSYMNISQSVRALNEPYNRPSVEIEDHLKFISHEIANICYLIFYDIGHDKYKYIRGEMYGRKFTNSARLVIEAITSDEYDDIDVCELPVEVFRNIYPSEIYKAGTKLKIPPAKLKDLTSEGYTTTEEDIDLLINDIFPLCEELVAYVNREPDIYVTSMYGLKVKKLTRDMALRIPIFILPSMVADFDGDVLSVIAWETPQERKRIYETLGVKKSCIDTFKVCCDKSIGPNNNLQIILYKGFSKPIELEEIS